MTLLCISCSSLANSCTKPSTACAVHCSPLHSALEAVVMPACTFPVLSPVYFQLTSAWYNTEKLEVQRVALGLQVSLCTAISLVSTQTSVRPGNKNISMRHKALHNCSDFLLSHFRQEYFFWFDIITFLLFFQHIEFPSGKEICLSKSLEKNYW